MQFNNIFVKFSDSKYYKGLEQFLVGKFIYRNNASGLMSYNFEPKFYG